MSDDEKDREDDPFEHLEESVGDREGDPFDRLETGDDDPVDDGSPEADREFEPERLGHETDTGDDQATEAAEAPVETPTDVENSAEDSIESPGDGMTFGIGQRESQEPGEGPTFSGTGDREGDPFGSVENAFAEMDVEQIDPDTVWQELTSAQSRGSVGDARKRTYAEVSKHSYCERCEHFSEPPDVHCSHEGTEIVEFLDMKTVRVVDCPVVTERKKLEDGSHDAIDDGHGKD